MSIKTSKLFRIFGKPSAVLLAQHEFDEAQRELLRAQSGAEYARTMVAYHEARVKRLGDYIRRAHSEADADGS